MSYSPKKKAPETGCMFYVLSLSGLVIVSILIAVYLEKLFPTYGASVASVISFFGLLGVIQLETYLRGRRELNHWLSNEYPGLAEKAECGDPKDQYDLGWSILMQDCEDKCAPTLYWMLKSAEQGYLSAQTFLAGHYRSGRGGNPDLEKAIFWYNKAAEQGDPESQLELAISYEGGLGVPKDLSIAIYWYHEAALHKGGREYVKWNNSHLYEPPGYSERENLYNSNEYSIQAWRKLGEFYLTGVGGLKRDEIEAYAYWNLAATAYSGGGALGDSDRKALADLEGKLTRAQIHAGKLRTVELRNEFKSKRADRELGL